MSLYLIDDSRHTLTSCVGRGGGAGIAVEEVGDHGSLTLHLHSASTGQWVTLAVQYLVHFLSHLSTNSSSQKYY